MSTFIEYEPWSPSDEALRDVQQAADICAEYADAGLDLTLRQLYYQFVARGWSENTERAYKRIGELVSRGRLAGLLPWSAIVDRTHTPRTPATWSSPGEIVAACAEQFRSDWWADQPEYVEVWVEKEALAGVFERPCLDLGVTLFACRGYVSQSALWRAAQRLIAESRKRDHVAPVILYFGDHDPSGIDMPRDIADRLDTFRLAVEVDRIALTIDQVRQYDPPPNPTKLTDSRAADYVSAYGHECWELDALEPSVLDDLIRSAVSERCNMTKLKRAMKSDKDSRKKLRALAQSL